MASSADPDGMKMDIRGGFRRRIWMTFALALVTLGAGWLAAQEVKRILSSGPEIIISATKPGGMAFDGTNLFVAAQRTDGALVLVRVPEGFPALPPETSLGRTGGVPRVAFDGTNVLMVWPDSADGAWDIYGQFFNRSGSAVGAAFLIEADADADKIGGLAFDGTNYLAVWEAGARSTGTVSSVQGWRIDTSGELLGARLQISSSSTAQKFPAVSWNGSAYFVAWTSRAENTNAWNVLGRRVSREGALSMVETLSEVPALAAWPPALASDGANWLAVWCRELGPFPVYSTNDMIPSVRGRIVNGSGDFGGGEFQVRRGVYGQFNPAVAFDGTNYIVAWLDRPLVSRFFPSYNSGFIYLREIDRRGGAASTEFMAGGLNETTESQLAVMGAPGWFVWAYGKPSQQATYGARLVGAVTEAPRLSEFHLLTNGASQFEMTSQTTFHAGLETTTNLVDWTVVNPSLITPVQAVSPGMVTVQIPGAGSETLRLFRALNAQDKCRGNLRLMRQAKDHWAQDYSRVSGQTPAATELFGPGRYLPNQPECPLGGTYHLNQMGLNPNCTLSAVAGHTY